MARGVMQSCLAPLLPLLASAGCDCGGRVAYFAELTPDGGQVDAAPDTSIAEDAGEPDTGPVLLDVCEHAAPGSDVSGWTPLGEVSLRYAWASLECYDWPIFRVAARPQLEYTGPFAYLVRPQEPWVLISEVDHAETGHHDVEVTVHARGESARATGRLEIARFDPPGDGARASRAEDGWCHCLGRPVDYRGMLFECEDDGRPRLATAHLTVDSSGWYLDGSITARHCHLFHTACF